MKISELTNPEEISPRTIEDILFSLDNFRMGLYMRKEKIPSHAIKNYQNLQNLIDHKNNDNRKIYRSVSFPLTDKKGCNYYSYFARNFNDRYIKTSNKVAQSWSLSSDFSSSWFTERPGFVIIMFETNIKRNKNLIISTPETLLNFLNKIRRMDVYDKLGERSKKDIDSIIHILPTDNQKEVMLLTPSKKVFVEKIHLLNCDGK